MRNSTITLVLILAAIGIGVAAQAVAQSSKGPASAPPEIVSEYQLMDKAAIQRDPNPIVKSYASGVKFFDQKGKQTSLTQMEPKVKDAIKGAQSTASQTTIKDVNVQPDGVTVTIQRRFNQTSIEPKTQILDTTVVSYTERDHWISAGGKWKINRARVLAMSAMFDGKPYTGPM